MRQNKWNGRKEVKVKGRMGRKTKEGTIHRERRCTRGSVKGDKGEEMRMKGTRGEGRRWVRGLGTLLRPGDEREEGKGRWKRVTRWKGGE